MLEETLGRIEQLAEGRLRAREAELVNALLAGPERQVVTDGDVLTPSFLRRQRLGDLDALRAIDLLANGHDL